MSEPVLVGRVAKAHGIRGEVSVEVLSDHPGRFIVGAVFQSGEQDLIIETIRPHQDRMLVKFVEVSDRNDAEAIRGAKLTIPAEERAALPEGHYYPSDLVGLDVVDPSGAKLGRFIRVVDSPAHDIWVVQNARGEVLVPAVKQFVIGVDLEARRITLDPPEGLF